MREMVGKDPNPEARDKTKTEVFVPH